MVAAEPLAGADDRKLEPLIFEAFYWGLISAISLQLGSVIGVTCLPGQKVRAVLMSFGGGALLFALSIELFSHVLHESEAEGSTAKVWVMEGSAVVGGCFFAALNYALNYAGADVRKPSTTKSRFARLRGLLMRRLAVRLLNIPFFSVLSLEELKDLIQSAMFKLRYEPGDIIMSDEAGDNDIFFILSGEVRVKICDEDEEYSPIHPAAKSRPLVRLTKSLKDGIDFSTASPFFTKTKSGFNSDFIPDMKMREWVLGPNQIFGDMTVLAGTHYKIVVEALAPTKVLVLPAHEVARLVETNRAVRDFVSLRACERLRQVSELQNLPEHALASLSTRCQLIRYRPGDMVFQGVVEEETPILCLVLGSVEICYQEGGKTRTLHASRLFCTEHLRTGADGPKFSAKAVEPTSILKIDRIDINSIMAQGGELGINDNKSDTSSEEGAARIVPGNVSLVKVAPAPEEGNNLAPPPERQPQKTPSVTSIVKVTAWMSNPQSLNMKEGGSIPIPKPSPRQDSKQSRRSNSNSLDKWSHLGWEQPAGENSSDDEDVKTKRNIALSRMQSMGMGQVTDMDLVEQEEFTYKSKLSSRNLFPPNGGELDSGSEATTKVGVGGCTIESWVHTDGYGSERSADGGQKPSRKQQPPQLKQEHDLERGGSADKLSASSDHALSASQRRAVMVWLGILIDAVPESLVIGIIINNSVHVSQGDQSANAAAAALPFVIGVFISNLPESMSSSGSMKAHGMKVSTILLMWATTTILTAIGSALGAVLFPPLAPGNDDTTTGLIIVAVEGLAAGAMLTMIAQTMMPEAFEQGGDIVGVSCLAGFLTALSVKLIPLNGGH